MQEEREERERLELVRIMKEGESNPEKSADAERNKSTENKNAENALSNIDTIGKLLVIKPQLPKRQS